MTCSSCGKQKATLLPKKSRLMTGTTLFMCPSCIEKKYEPRWIIVLYGRKNGLTSIKDYIHPKRYEGKDILASEIG